MSGTLTIGLTTSISTIFKLRMPREILQMFHKIKKLLWEEMRRVDQVEIKIRWWKLKGILETGIIRSKIILKASLRLQSQGRTAQRINKILTICCNSNKICLLQVKMYRKVIVFLRSDQVASRNRIGIQYWMRQELKLTPNSQPTSPRTAIMGRIAIIILAPKI